MALAISHANWILDCSANFTDESEHPKTWMWAHDDVMETHFDRVKKAREEKYGVKKDSDDDNMMQNEYAEQYKR